MWMMLLSLVSDTAGFAVAVTPAESLRVTVAGTGTPVILLPGLFGSAYAYRQLAPLLVASGHRAIVIEPLGVGSSARPARADYSLTAQAGRVAAVLDSLGLRDAVVVAHAVGASIALRLAVHRPDLVRGIVSIEGGPAESATTPGFRRALQLVPWVKLLGGVRRIRRKVRDQLVSGSGDPSWISDDVVEGYTAGAARDLDATLRAFVAMGRAREPERLGPQLGRIRCPVLLLLGSVPHDGGPGPVEVALLARHVVRFRVDTVMGVGHFVHEESPAAVLEAIRAVAGGAIS